MRHAESTANAGLGVAAIGGDWKELTNQGRNQVVELVELINNAEIKPSKIISSPLVRAVQTAQPLADKFALTVELDDNFKEFDYLRPLDPTVMTREERNDQRFRFWNKSSIDYDYIDGGIESGAESFANFITRARRCLEKLAVLPANSFIVSHGVMLLTILSLIDNARDGKVYDEIKSSAQSNDSFVIKNAQVVRLSVHKNSLHVDSVNLFQD